VVRRVEEVWGTVVGIDVRDEIDARVVDECFAFFQRVDDLFSTWRDDTEIMRLARGELALDAADPAVREVLALCEHMRLESGGAFDIAAGAHPDAPARPGLAPLDPSGLVKGWAVARAGDRLLAAGSRSWSINGGGDVLTHGRPAPDVDTWRVGIQHPYVRDRVAAVLAVNDAAIATSGRYERGDHVLDPRTGRPATGLASVTVVGSDLAVADAYATAVVVLGADAGMRWIATRVGYEALAITDHDAVLSTPGLARYRVQKPQTF